MKISLVPFSFSVYRKKKMLSKDEKLEPLILNKLGDVDYHTFDALIKDYLKFITKKAYIDRAERKVVQNYFGPDSSVIDMVTGQVYVGSYGAGAEIYDIHKEEMIPLKLESYHSPLLYHYYQFFYEDDTDSGILLLQKNGVHGIKGIVEASLSSFLSKTSLSIELKKKFTEEMYNAMIESAMEEIEIEFDVLYTTPEARGRQREPGLFSSSTSSRTIKEKHKIIVGVKSILPKDYKGVISSIFKRQKAVLENSDFNRVEPEVFNVKVTEPTTAKGKLEMDGGKKIFVTDFESLSYHAGHYVGRYLEDDQNSMPTYNEIMEEGRSFLDDLLDKEDVTRV